MLHMMATHKLMLLSMFLVSLSACNSKESVADRENCLSLSKGMTLEQVIEIMGEPKERRVVEYPAHGLALSYSTQYLADGALTIYLQKVSSGHVLESAFCDLLQ